MTDRKTIDQITSNELDELYDQLDRVRTLRDTWLRMTLEPGQVRRLLDGITTALTPPAEPQCGAVHPVHPDTRCTSTPGHYQPNVGPHSGPWITDGNTVGLIVWDEPAATKETP